MKISVKLVHVLLYALPIFGMIALIPFVQNDYVLTCIYVLCLAMLLVYRREPHDILAVAVGLVAITVAEVFFVSTGVETFARTTLFGIMPLWLPVLWAYVFVTVKRSLRILDAQ